MNEPEEVTPSMIWKVTKVKLSFEVTLVFFFCWEYLLLCTLLKCLSFLLIFFCSGLWLSTSPLSPHSLAGPAAGSSWTHLASSSRHRRLFTPEDAYSMCGLQSPWDFRGWVCLSEICWVQKEVLIGKPLRNARFDARNSNNRAKRLADLLRLPKLRERI